MKESRFNLQYLRQQWKRGVIRAGYRFLTRIGYYFSPSWALNLFFLSMPDELIVENLNKFGALIGKDTTVMPPLHVHNIGTQASDHFKNLTVGRQCYIGPDLFLDLKDHIEIEDRVTISMRVSLVTHLDAGESPVSLDYFPPQHKPIVLKEGVYIGAGACILMGVTIGEGAVIGAGSVITRDVPAHSVIVGGTSRIVRQLED